jgi:hypothetical protein
MGWRDLLGTETITLPWVAGSSLISRSARSWDLARRPPEPGWHKFRLEGRKAYWESAQDPQPEILLGKTSGYLLVPDSASCLSGLAALHTYPKVHLLPDGLDRLSRVEAGQAFPDGPWIFVQTAWPLGPEDEVLQAWLDRQASVAHIQHVVPALDLAFQLETFQRAETERLRREAQERAEKEERLRQAREAMGTAQGRRELARLDFEAAARAALAISGARYLDHRPAPTRGEMVVRYQVDDHRLECVCRQDTLAIVDSGVCLTAHYDDDQFEEGTRGDGFFTLESLPSVIREADRLDKLVVYRRG